jgi:hypothetical protein
MLPKSRNTCPLAKGTFGPLNTAATVDVNGKLVHCVEFVALALHAPRYPTNTEPPAEAVDVSNTPLGAVACENVAEQPVVPATPFVIVQLIPVGVLLTVPLPLPRPTTLIV